MSWKFIVIASRIVIGSVFIIASFHKIIYPADFALSIFRYQLMWGKAINLFALFLPWLELVTGILIIFGRRFVDAATWLIIAMLVMFIGAVGINIYRGVDIACGCFSNDPKANKLGWETIIRNAGMLFLSVLILVHSRKAAKESRAAAAQA